MYPYAQQGKAGNGFFPQLRSSGHGTGPFLVCGVLNILVNLMAPLALADKENLVRLLGV